MQESQPEPLAVRDRLRQNFARLGVKSRVELTTYGLNRAVVVNPLTLAEAVALADALEPATGTGCPGGHDGELEERADGKYCQHCGHLIYAARPHPLTPCPKV